MESFIGFNFSFFILEPYHVADIPQYVFLSSQWGNEIFLKLHVFVFFTYFLKHILLINIFNLRICLLQYG